MYLVKKAYQFNSKVFDKLGDRVELVSKELLDDAKKIKKLARKSLKIAFEIAGSEELDIIKKSFATTFISAAMSKYGTDLTVEQYGLISDALVAGFNEITNAIAVEIGG